MTVEVTERPIEFHGKPALLSVVRDITERERAMVALQAAKDYAENIINSSLDMIVSVDTERRIIAFNHAAQQAFGYQPDEVLGQPVHLLYADPAVGLVSTIMLSPTATIQVRLRTDAKMGRSLSPICRHRCSVTVRGK